MHLTLCKVTSSNIAAAMKSTNPQSNKVEKVLIIDTIILIVRTNKKIPKNNSMVIYINFSTHKRWYNIRNFY